MEMDCHALENERMKIKVALAGLDIELSDRPRILAPQSHVKYYPFLFSEIDVSNMSWQIMDSDLKYMFL